MELCPCRNCEIRKSECHGTCSAYKHWRDQMDIVREEKHEDQLLDHFFTKPRYRDRREVKR